MKKQGRKERMKEERVGKVNKMKEREDEKEWKDTWGK